MARRRRRDVVAEMQEDSSWSAFTQESTRFRARGKPLLSRADPSMWVYMLVAAAALSAFIGLFALIAALTR